MPLKEPVVPITSSLLENQIDVLLRQYRFISCETIGRSILGKPLYALSIGNGPREIMINAAHHANEWITGLVVMRFLEEYAYICEAVIGGGNPYGAFKPRGNEGFDRGANMSNMSRLLDDTTLYILPMVNPDGADLVNGAISRNSPEYREAAAMRRAALGGAGRRNTAPSKFTSIGLTPPESFPACWKANIRGIDLNSNYPAGWETAKQIKYTGGYTQPGPRDYVGPAPLSEPETQAMEKFTREHSFRLTLSYHTQGEEIYWRYGKNRPVGDNAIARLFSSASGYALEDVPDESGHAGYKDWFIQTFNRPGFTIECGNGVNPLPLSQFKRICRDNTGLLMLALFV